MFSIDRFATSVALMLLKGASPVSVYRKFSRDAINRVSTSSRVAATRVVDYGSILLFFFVIHCLSVNIIQNSRYRYRTFDKMEGGGIVMEGSAHSLHWRTIRRMLPNFPKTQHIRRVNPKPAKQEKYGKKEQENGSQGP